MFSSGDGMSLGSSSGDDRERMSPLEPPDETLMFHDVFDRDMEQSDILGPTIANSSMGDIHRPHHGSHYEDSLMEVDMQVIGEVTAIGVAKEINETETMEVEDSSLTVPAPEAFAAFHSLPPMEEDAIEKVHIGLLGDDSVGSAGSQSINDQQPTRTGLQAPQPTIDEDSTAENRPSGSTRAWNDKLNGKEMDDMGITKDRKNFQPTPKNSDETETVENTMAGVSATVHVFEKDNVSDKGVESLSDHNNMRSHNANATMVTSSNSATTKSATVAADSQEIINRNTSSTGDKESCPTEHVVAEPHPISVVGSNDTTIASESKGIPTPKIPLKHSDTTTKEEAYNKGAKNVDVTIAGSAGNTDKQTAVLRAYPDDNEQSKETVTNCMDVAQPGPERSDNPQIHTGEALASIRAVVPPSDDSEISNDPQDKDNSRADPTLDTAAKKTPTNVGKEAAATSPALKTGQLKMNNSDSTAHIRKDLQDGPVNEVSRTLQNSTDIDTKRQASATGDNCSEQHAVPNVQGADKANAASAPDWGPIVSSAASREILKQQLNRAAQTLPASSPSEAAQGASAKATSTPVPLAVHQDSATKLVESQSQHAEVSSTQNSALRSTASPAPDPVQTAHTQPMGPRATSRSQSLGETEQQILQNHGRPLSPPIIEDEALLFTDETLEPFNFGYAATPAPAPPPAPAPHPYGNTYPQRPATAQQLAAPVPPVHMAPYPYAHPYHLHPHHHPPPYPYPPTDPSLYPYHPQYLPHSRPSSATAVASRPKTTAAAQWPPPLAHAGNGTVSGNAGKYVMGNGKTYDPALRTVQSSHSHMGVNVAIRPKPAAQAQGGSSHSHALHQDSRFRRFAKIRPYADQPIRVTRDQILKATPELASSIFHLFDRRINFDAHPSNATLYSLLRSWVQDDPYRQFPPAGSSLLSYVTLPSEVQPVLGKHESHTGTEMQQRHRESATNKRERVDNTSGNLNRVTDCDCRMLGRGKVDIIRILQSAPFGSNSLERVPPSVDMLRSEMLGKATASKRKQKAKYRARLATSLEMLRKRGIVLTD